MKEGCQPQEIALRIAIGDRDRLLKGSINNKDKVSITHSDAKRRVELLTIGPCAGCARLAASPQDKKINCEAGHDFASKIWEISTGTLPSLVKCNEKIDLTVNGDQTIFIVQTNADGYTHWVAKPNGQIK